MRQPSPYRRSCGAQRSYPDREAAKDAAAKISSQSGVMVLHYPCPECNRFHITLSHRKEAQRGTT